MGRGDPAETSVSASTSRMTLNLRALVSRAGMNARKPSFLLFVQKCFILNAVICYLNLYFIYTVSMTYIYIHYDIHYTTHTYA